MSAKVLPFNRYILTDIPAALRVLAEQIEHDPALARRCIVCLEPVGAEPTYKAFGEDFTIAHAAGLVATIQAVLINQVLER